MLNHVKFSCAVPDAACETPHMSNLSAPPQTKRFSWRVVLWIVCGLCVALLIFYTYFYLDQERWIFQPNTEPTGGEEIVDLEPALEGWLSPPGKLLLSANETSSIEVAIHFQKFSSRRELAKGCILYCHGNRGNLEKCRWEIKGFLDEGYDVWMMDYRTYGDSKGPLSETALVNDARMFYDYLLQSGIDEKDLIVWGRSFGSGIAASVAANNSPKMLILETPYWSLPDAARRSNPLLLPFLFRYRLPTFEYLEFINCPVHLIHGDNDEKISHESSKALEGRCVELNIEVEPHLIEGGNHNLREMNTFNAILKAILN